MEFCVGLAPVGFSHGNTTAFGTGSEPPLVSVCVCVCVCVCVLNEGGYRDGKL